MFSCIIPYHYRAWLMRQTIQGVVHPMRLSRPFSRTSEASLFWICLQAELLQNLIKAELFGARHQGGRGLMGKGEENLSGGKASTRS